MEIGNQMQNNKIETNSELNMMIVAFDRLKFLSKLLAANTVIPFTTVRGPLYLHVPTFGEYISCPMIC